MALSENHFAALDSILAAGADTAGLADFRRRFPALTVTRCDATDIDIETPFREYPGASLFLVDRSDHCWRITSDPARATGILVARHKALA